jgi:Methyltransferase domain/Family of unknown function (DUF6492)
MKTSILIVSYLKDLPWLHHCLRSIEKFARGFYETVVLVPEDEVRQFRAQMPFTLGTRLTTYKRVPEAIRWHIHAQTMKCYADEICPRTDFILHTDSDCIFSKPVTPQDYITNGKPVMLIEPYAGLPGCPWQPVTQSILKRDVEFEFMRRHPQVNPVGVYADLREHVCFLHEKSFDNYVLSLKPDYPWGVSEHNLIGAFAYYDKRWTDKYRWIDISKEKRPADKLIQFWSYSPPDKPQDSPNGLRCVPAQVIASILDNPKANSPHPTSRDVFGYWLNDHGLVGEGVEVGCAYGHNASTILSQWKGQKLYMVDPWQRQPEEVYREDTKQIDYEVWYKDCCALAERDPRAVIRREFSVEAAKTFADESLDFVYIDGNHSYAAVLADMDAWWPKVKSGGMFCGHDAWHCTDPPHFCEVLPAIQRWFLEHKLPFTVTECTSWWSRKP